MLSRYELLRNPKVIGEIIADIGIGFLVNAMFALTHEELEFINFVDAIIGIIMIVEGNIAKYKE